MTHKKDSEPVAQVHAVTDANEAASIESKQRLRAYSIKMALRVVFFVGGAIVAVTWNKWVGLALLGVSAVLPWLAVMGANLIRPPESVTGAEYGVKQDPRSLEARTEEADGEQDPERPGGGIVIDATFLEDPAPPHEDREE